MVGDAIMDALGGVDILVDNAGGKASAHRDGFAQRTPPEAGAPARIARV